MDKDTVMVFLIRDIGWKGESILRLSHQFTVDLLDKAGLLGTYDWKKNKRPLEVYLIAPFDLGLVYDDLILDKTFRKLNLKMEHLEDAELGLIALGLLGSKEKMKPYLEKAEKYA